MYNTPLTTSGVPAFFLTTISPNPMSVTEDSAGNVFAGLSNLNCCIDVFPAPVTGAATAGLEVNANGVSPLGLGFVYGVAMDSSNNLYASSAGSGGVGHLSTIQMHTPMTASSKPAAAVGAAFPLYDVAVDASNNVYVTNATTQGTIDVFTQPFTSASKRSFGIVVHNGTYLQGLAFDGFRQPLGNRSDQRGVGNPGADHGGEHRDAGPHRTRRLRHHVWTIIQ